MNSITLSAPGQASLADPAPSTAPVTPVPAPTPGAVTPGAVTPGLGAEVRESLVLLAFAVAATVGLTTAAQAALAVLS